MGLLLVLYLTLLDAEVKTMMVGPPWAPGRAHNSRSGPSVLDPGSLLLPLHTTQGDCDTLCVEKFYPVGWKISSTPLWLVLNGKCTFALQNLHFRVIQRKRP